MALHGKMAMVIAMGWAGALATAAAAQSPAAVIRARNESVTATLNAAGDSVSDATKERLKDILNSFIDFDELSRRALGRYWDERTPQERKDFVAVFRQLVRNGSVRKLEVYKADRVEYPPPVERGDSATVTTVAFKGAKSVTIVYQMHRVGSRWQAYDVVIDGASTARTYRDSFAKEIARSSYTAMYEKLSRRAKES